jgi:hypothetical protein
VSTVRTSLISEKSFCFCQRYCHKKRLGDTFGFEAFDPREDSVIVYKGERWGAKSSFVLDVVAQEIFNAEYLNKQREHFPTPNRRDKRILKRLVSIDTDGISRGEISEVKKLSLSERHLREKYPFIFKEELGSDEISGLLRLVTIPMMVLYRVVTNDDFYFYRMRRFESVCYVEETPVRTSKNGRVLERDFIISFGSPLGAFFYHNVCCLNVLYVPIELYSCGSKLSNFIYKRFRLCMSKRERRIGYKEVELMDLGRYFNFSVSSYENLKSCRREVEKSLDELEDKGLLQYSRVNRRGYRVAYWIS